jgi:hypothetical protein
MFLPYPGSNFFHPGSNFFHPGFEFFPSRINIKEFKYGNPKNCFSSSRKYDLGCSSRVWNPDPEFFPITDPGFRVKKAPDPGSKSATLLTRRDTRVKFIKRILEKIYVGSSYRSETN